MKNKFKIIGLILTILILWQLIYLVFNIQSSLIPSPIIIFQTFVELIFDGEIFIHILNSLLRVVVGFLIATFVALVLSMVFGVFRKTGELFKPIIEILRPIPPIAWIPIAIIIFGLGNNSAYFIVFLGAFFPIFTNSYFGVLSLPNICKNVSATFELKKIVFLFKILIPFSLPFIFTGLRIGMGMAWMSVIAAELIGAQSGLGYFIQISRLLLQTDNIIVGMIIIGLVGYLLIKVIDIFEYILIPWNRKNYVAIK